MRALTRGAHGHAVGRLEEALEMVLGAEVGESADFRNGELRRAEQVSHPSKLHGLDRGEHGPPRNLAEAQVEKPAGDTKVARHVGNAEFPIGVVADERLGFADHEARRAGRGSRFAFDDALDRPDPAQGYPRSVCGAPRTAG